jgi:hypothetical protein
VSCLAAVHVHILFQQSTADVINRRAQAERPEDDPDVRGGGRAAEDARIVKGADYASDDEEPLRNEDNVRLAF